MPLYSLVASGRSDVQVSEIVLSRDADGEVEHRVTVGEANEVPDELAPAARTAAAQLGMRLIEIEPVKEDSVAAQMDADAAAQASLAPDTPSETPNPDASTFTPTNT